MHSPVRTTPAPPPPPPPAPRPLPILPDARPHRTGVRSGGQRPSRSRANRRERRSRDFRGSLRWLFGVRRGIRFADDLVGTPARPWLVERTRHVSPIRERPPQSRRLRPRLLGRPACPPLAE